MNEPLSSLGAGFELQRKIRVVLVDDSVVATTVLSRVLRKLFSLQIVAVAKSGQEGLALATELKPDLVITDLQMPGLDGLQLVRLLRQQHPSIRSIVVSVWDGPAVHEASLQHGADAFITKSRLPEELPPVFARLFSCLTQEAPPGIHV